MKNLLLLALFVSITSLKCFSQGFTRQSYHDKEKKHLKEVYLVKDTIRNVLHGRYISYYLNGNIESKGQFTNNETTGVWEFYYETGKLKMRGILKHSANYGLWEYFYESGQKSMEGNINGKNREGEWKSYYENGHVKEVGEYVKNKRVGVWKTYFEDDILKGEIDYADDHGTYTEYYHSGKVHSEGPRAGNKNVGHWRFFAEDGTLQSEGDYDNGRKNGEWINYFPNGETASKGRYEQDVPTGVWEYYFENGAIASSGEYVSGKKAGHWKVMNENGSLKSEIQYENGYGEYREYFASGKLRAKGRYLNDKKDGKWQYFYEDGKREGECDYENNKGTYYGYFPNGNLQTKGAIDGDLKTGTWEIYESDGKLAGYYRPFYDDKKLSNEITGLAKNSTAKTYAKKRNLGYFDERFNEFKGVIISSNPIMTFTGQLPIAIEFYNQERLGHEFEFIGLRDPFFKADRDIPTGQQFERGYSLALKQKFYNQFQGDMWYFGHEFRFTNNAHFVNELVTPQSKNVLTFGAAEQRVEYGPLVGYRIMKKNNSTGLTVDAFASGNIGYRNFDVENSYKPYFENVSESKIALSYHLGVNIGYVFSFK